MQVWTTPRARATIGGPSLDWRTHSRAVLFQRTTTVSAWMIEPQQTVIMKADSLTGRLFLRMPNGDLTLLKGPCHGDNRPPARARRRYRPAAQLTSRLHLPPSCGPVMGP